MSLLIKKTKAKLTSELPQSAKIFKGNNGNWNEDFDEVIYTNFTTFVPQTDIDYQNFETIKANMLFKSNLNQIDDFQDAYSVKPKDLAQLTKESGGNPLQRRKQDAQILLNELSIFYLRLINFMHWQYEDDFDNKGYPKQIRLNQQANLHQSEEILNRYWPKLQELMVNIMTYKTSGVVVQKQLEISEENMLQNYNQTLGKTTESLKKPKLKTSKKSKKEE